MLVVPSLVIGRRGSSCWVTRIDGGDSGIPEPRQLGEPFPSSFSPALMTEAGYVSAVASAVHSITSGAARKIVVARDLCRPDSG